ncbi:MAG: EAL domain-containing protein [Acidimicrobiales bacterium]|jgi:diguanylate cyclase (GGDEF)-like protein/PAS domain S-box-containing protein
MAFEGLRRLTSGEAKGMHFAEMLFMGPLAAVAILVLRQFHLVVPSPIWLIPVILVVGQLASTATGFWWDESPTQPRLHLRIGTQIILVTAVIYATGWGPALAIGLVLVGQESLAITGSTSLRVVLVWTLSCLAIGEGLVGLGWIPSLVPMPEGYGLAILMCIGIAFSYRSLLSALREKEETASLTESRERRFRALVQSSSDLVFAVDRNSEVTYASPSCTSVLGYQPDQLVGSAAGNLIHPDDIDELRSTIGQVSERSGASVEFSIRVRHARGQWHWLEGLATNLLDDPAVEGTVINARDVTKRRERLERQAAISDLGRDVLRATTLDMAVVSATDAIEHVMHPRACRVVEATSEGRPERPPGLPWPEPSPIGSDGTAESDGPALVVPVGDPERPLAFIQILQDGPTTADDDQFLEGVSGVVLSAIVRFRAEDAIRHQAMHDPLTGLANRALFNDRLEYALRRRSRKSGFVGVMIVDLDGFKNINDGLGHLAGDALLIGVADRFSRILRDPDTIARLGGDEFAILIDDLEAEDQAAHVAQRMLDALVDPVPLPDQDVAIGASVGIAITDGAHAKADRLLSDADAAMYQAKRAGKGCYRVFRTAMHAAAVDRVNLEQDLRAAIRDNSLTVSYQPIVNVRSGEVSSFEALARWRHRIKGDVSPKSFIPLAEDSGLIIELGRAVLVEACQQASQWRSHQSGAVPTVSVNASRLQLAHPEFIEHVSDALRRADLEPSSLIIEVTESVLAAESVSIIETLNDLQRMGTKISIDDFGTGYSSFAALADLPIDIIKIDKRFVDNLLHDDQGRGFVNAIMLLANTLRLETTAEGVELSAQYHALAELGCTHVQGFLFSRPIPGDETLAFLDHHHAPSADPMPQLVGGDLLYPGVLE